LAVAQPLPVHKINNRRKNEYFNILRAFIIISYLLESILNLLLIFINKK
jgi:hypothetical protein